MYTSLVRKIEISLMNIPAWLGGFLLVVLSGCASVNLSDPAEVFNNVSIRQDDYKKTRTFSGPDIYTHAAYARLRWEESYHPERPNHREELFFVLYADGWIFHNEAYDWNGTKLQVIPVERRLNGCSKGTCSTTESAVVVFPSGYFEHNVGGFKVQATGPHGRTVIEVPGSYVQGFLKAVMQ